MPQQTADIFIFPGLAKKEGNGKALLPVPLPSPYRLSVEVKRLGCDPEFGTTQVVITYSWVKKPLRFGAVGKEAVVSLVERYRELAEANGWGFDIHDPEHIAEKAEAL